MDDILGRLRRGEHWPQAAADEIERLRAGGCARDQSTTQYCAEAAEIRKHSESHALREAEYHLQRSLWRRALPQALQDLLADD